MNDIYEKNINTIKNTDIRLYNKLKDNIDSDCDNVHINDKCGVEVCVDCRWWSLGSRYNSQYAVDRWLEQFDNMHYKNVFIVYGLANGEYIRALSKIIGEENAIIVYEPVKEIFIEVIKHIDISDILEDERILICVNGINGELIEEYIKYGINYELLELVRVESSPNYFRLFKNEYEDFKKNIDHGLIINMSHRKTNLEYGEEIGITKIVNIWELMKGSTIDELKEVLKDRIDNIPAIIVSAGPSLDKNIDDIAEAKGKAFIIAVDSAIRKMIEHNIIPDIVATIDSHKPMILFESDKAKEIPIVISGQSRHEIVRQHRGKRFIYTGNDFYRYFIDKWHKSISALMTGGSVANDAYSLAEYLGFKIIIFAGQDLALTDNRKHASSVYDEKPIENIKESKSYIYVKDNDGNDILTYINLKLYKDWFEERIAANKDIEVINATEGGAKIEGTKVMTLKDAIKTYCKKNISVDITQAQPLFDKDEMKDVYREIKNLVHECDNLIAELKNGLEKYDEIVDCLNSGNIENMEKYVKEIDKVNSDIQKSELMEIISLCSKSQEIAISDKIYSEEDDMSVLRNMVDYSRQLLEIYKENTEMIKQKVKEMIRNEIDVDIANGYFES